MTALKFSTPKSLPPGRYPATLVDVSEGEGKFGPYLEWTFDALDPDGSPKQVSRRTSTKTGSGAIARVLVESLLARTVRVDEEVDPGGLIGKGLDIEIETNANGYDHVVNAWPAGTSQSDEVSF